MLFQIVMPIGTNSVLTKQRVTYQWADFQNRVYTTNLNLKDLQKNK